MNNDLKQRIDRIKQTVDLPNLLLQYGVNLKKQGSGYIARCINPMHEDKNPSMGVFRVKGESYHRVNCPSCGLSEDVVGVYKILSGDDLHEALDALDGGEIKHSGKPFAKIINEPTPQKPERTVSPPPEGTPDPIWNRAVRRNEKDEWVSLGEPVNLWAYRTLEGALWYYEARYEYINEDGEVKKEPRCWTWGNRGSMPARWELGFPPPPRPLYGLHELATATQALIFEGPKKAEAARMMLNGNTTVACLAWPGGARGVSRADWSPLYGMDAIITPDADDPGRNAANEIAAILNGNGSKVFVTRTDDLPKAWDVADAHVEGWDKAKLLAFLRSRKEEWEPPAAKEQEAEPDYSAEPSPIPEPPDDSYDSYADAADTNDSLQWPEPLDIYTEIQAPPIKLHQLPEPIAAWVDDVAGVIGVDPSMLALPAIVAAASMIHDGIQLQPETNNPGWKESARLWGALVGDPSSKKSPALSKVLGIVKKIDAECHDKEGKLRYEYSLKEKAHATSEKTYIEKLSKGEQNLTVPCKPEMPEIPRAYAQDCTVEALRDILKHSTRGVLAERDELSGWFGSMDQYKSGGKGGSDRANWLELYNGGSRRIDRVGAGSIFVKNWSACLIGGIQPEPLKQIASNMNEDGLLQRFMVCYGRPGKQGNEKAPDHAIEQRYRAIMRQLWDTQPDLEPIHLSPEANAIRKEIVDRAYELIGIRFISNSMVAHLGKWEGLSARLMLTFHAIDCAALSLHPQSCRVSGETASRVKAFMLEFLLPHAIQFYMDILGGTEATKHFTAIANLILTKHPKEITLREMLHGWIGWRHAGDQVQCHVINRLIDAGWIQAPLGARVSANRRIHTRYICNPMLLDKFARQAEKEKARREEARQIIESIRGVPGE